MTQKFPSKDEVLSFIEASSHGVSKREIVRAFNIASDDRKNLRQLLMEMAKEGRITKTRNNWHKSEHASDNGAAVETFVIVNDDPMQAVLLNTHDADTDEDEGDETQLLSKKERLPVIFAKRRSATLRKGEHIIAQIIQKNDVKSALYIGRIARKHQSFLALFQESRSQKTAILEPIHKGKSRTNYMVPEEHRLDAKHGDLVRAEPLRGPSRRGAGMEQAKVTQILSSGSKGALALNEIALIEQNIPREFSRKTLDEAKALGAPKLEGRVDLRHIPFVTIDGADAKDFDDAVFASYDTETSSFHVYVAIADVSWYVRPNTSIDDEALERGNSVYLPGMVVPMLPEHLSNGWCSLNPHEDRGSLVCEMRINTQGEMTSFKFYRAMICSHARLTYSQTHRFFQGYMDAIEQTEVHESLQHLYSVYLLRDNIRKLRGALELESDERKVYVDEEGKIEAIKPALSYESNKLIEEMMILANVAAAMQLEKSGYDQKKLCMYRVHAEPSSERLMNLMPLFQSLDIKPGSLQSPSSKDLNQILQQAKDKKVSHLVSKAILRCQAQAQYSPNNEGHYGLALEKYCHFTSPIRRYPDLLVHRALVEACKLGDGGLGKKHASFEQLAEHCCLTERRAVFAERDTLDRLTAQFLSEQQGAVFQAAVDGVNRAGVFITLDETGASGFCPMGKLPWDQYVYDEGQQAVISLTSRKAYRLGDAIRVRLLEVAVVAGSMIFEVLDAPQHHIGKPKHLDKSSSKKEGNTGGKRKGRKGRKGAKS